MSEERLRVIEAIVGDAADAAGIGPKKEVINNIAREIDNFSRDFASKHQRGEITASKFKILVEEMIRHAVAKESESAGLAMVEQERLISTVTERITCDIKSADHFAAFCIEPWWK